MAKITLDEMNPDMKIKQEELLDKFEKESKTRTFDHVLLVQLIYYVTIGIALYHLITSFIGYPATHLHRSLHVSMMLFMTFFLYPFSNKAPRKTIPWYDIVLALLSVAVAVYVWVDYINFINRMGSPNTMDVVMGTILIVLVLEASRRISGWPLVILSLLFLLYGLVGRNLPGIFMHRGYDWRALVNHIFINTEGIYGTSVDVAASYIFLFIMFGTVMNKCGMGRFFNDLALAFAGSSKGGPAKVAVIASGFLGSINGSAVANVVTTGAFTIPLMKKTGYSKEFAGAVESSASVGGQLLPPIMGAAAFIMAEMLGIKYGTIVISAAIPALLYYLGILVQVQLRASKKNLKGIPKEDLPKVRDVMRERGHLLIPIAFLLYMLLFSGATVIFSAFWAIVATIAVSMARKSTRMTFKQILDAFSEGTRAGSLGCRCLCSGGNHHRCGKPHRLRLEHGECHHSARPIKSHVDARPYHGHLHDFGHGPSFHPCLSDYRHHGRPCLGETGNPPACRSYVRLLLCDVCQHHPAGSPCVICCCGSERWRPDENRPAISQAFACRIHRPLYVHLQHCLAFDRYHALHCDQGLHYSNHRSMYDRNGN